jgi:hypothetical protein
MTDDMTPLEVCERLIGPLPVLAEICGYGRTAAYIWRKGGATRDKGDLPSPRLMRTLLDHSDAHALGLTAEHLIRGADSVEIEAILAARQPSQQAAA